MQDIFRLRRLKQKGASKKTQESFFVLLSFLLYRASFHMITLIFPLHILY